MNNAVCLRRAAVTSTPRADGSSDAQTFQLLDRLPPDLVSGAAGATLVGAGDGGANGTLGSTAAAPACVNGTQGSVSGNSGDGAGGTVSAVTAAAPPLDRCYALMGLFVDYMSSAYARSPSGKLEKSGITVSHKQALYLAPLRRTRVAARVQLAFAFMPTPRAMGRHTRFGAVHFTLKSTVWYDAALTAGLHAALLRRRWCTSGRCGFARVSLTMHASMHTAPSAACTPTLGWACRRTVAVR